MKKIVSLLLAVGTLFSTNLLAQEDQGVHYDNKPYIEGQFLIQLNDGASMRDFTRKAPSDWNLQMKEFISPPMRIWTVTFDHNVVPHWQFQNWCYEQEEVSVADYDYYIEMRSTIPGDPSFNTQWHHNNTGQTGGTTDADIDSDLAWDITTGGLTATNDDIVVCMVEGGGGNLAHQDLDPNRWINNGEIDGNGIDDDGNGYVDDYYGWNTGTNDDNTGTGGHGTNCLGMIGAKGDNGLNVAGANWDVKLMVLNMGGGLSQSNVIAAYTYPLVMRQMWNNSGGTQGAFVVATSASWGIDGADPASYPLWCNFYDTLGTYGIINVGATTNSNFDVDVTGDMPTACSSPYMVGVGRSDHNDNFAGGYGDQTIDFAAPGINVVTTNGTTGITTTTGTSFACPLTAGVIGLAYSIPCTDFMSIVVADPQAGADLVLQALWDGVDVTTAMTGNFVHDGRLNSRNTLDELMAVACSGTVCISPSGVNSSNVMDNSADITFTPYASADETVLYWQEQGSGSWNVVSNASSPESLSGLTACTTYEFYLVSVCGTDTSGQTSTQTFTTSGCGACIDLNYCASSAANDEEWIEDFTLDTYTNVSGADGGYGDYTSVSNITLDLNIPYNFTVTPAWQGTQYDEWTRIWVDLDQSGTFDTGEMLYDQGASAQTPVNGTITIPLGTPVGSTRMRVQMAYDDGSGSAGLPAVCDAFTYGEVEDYCVYIQSACTFTVTSSITNPTCNGDTDGAIDITVSGAVSPYTYSWSTGATTEDITGLGDGTYSVTISDASACGDTTLNFTITEPGVLTANASATDVTCNGDGDGAVDLTVTGGTTPYSYSWNTGATTEDLTGLNGGSYSVTVTDANGCTANTNATVNEPAALTGVLTTNNGSCATGGDASISVSGGTPGYTYLWSTGGTGTSVTGLNSGPISVDVTDANGCTITESGTIAIPGAPTVSLNNATDPTCAGGTDGAIDVDVTGGTAPFTYSWDNGGTTEDLTGIGAGTYVLTLTDDNGCQATFSHTLTEPSAITASATTTNVVSGNDGSIDLTVGGGTPPYTYSWSPGGETTEDLSNLNSGGVYTVTITDANGCVETLDVTVISEVGIDQFVLDNLVIYPNPTNGQLNIVLQESVEVEVTIFNSVGQQILTTNTNGDTQTELDLSNLSSGVYIVTLIAEDGSSVNRRITVSK